MTVVKVDLKDFLVGKDSGDLIEILHYVQEEYGYIPKEAVREIAETLDIGMAEIYGVITFYSRFTMVPSGKYAISVCMGTACYVKGAEDILEEFSERLGIKIGDTTEDLMYSLVETRCVGDCAKAPVVTVNEKVYAKVHKDDVTKILLDMREE